MKFAWYSDNDGNDYFVTVENEDDNRCVVELSDGRRLSVLKEELKLL